MKISDINLNHTSKKLEFQNPKIEFDYKQLWKVFKKNWLRLQGCELEETPEVIENYKPLFFYFAEDSRFFKCRNLYKEKNNPSFEKGLLIVGSYGLGKSAVMETLQASLIGTDKEFIGTHAMAVVDEFEACKTSHDKIMFNRRHINGTFLEFRAKPRYFDDVKTEREASNYGKTNLFKDILEKRYSNKALTHLTCNYHPEHEGDLQEALREFDEKYGGRVYDRIFSMFNIIEFKKRRCLKYSNNIYLEWFVYFDLQVL